MAYIKGKQLAQGTIDTRELKDSGVTNAKIAASTIEADRLNISGAAWDFSGASSLSVPTPTADAHAASKSYVDAVSLGLDVKESVRAATTSSADLSGFVFANGYYNDINNPTAATFVIDGVSLGLGDRFLIKDATNPAQNGIFYVDRVGNGSSIPWYFKRALDANTADKLTNGTFVFVGEGNTLEAAGFVLTTPDPITIDTSALTFTQFSGAGQITAGDGLVKSGNTLSLDLAAVGGLEIDGSAKLSLKLADVSLELVAGGLKAKLGTDGSMSLSGGLISAQPTGVDQIKTPATTYSTDASATNITLTKAPAGGAQPVEVYVNGVQVRVGNGVTNLDCYFSSDNGATALTFGNIGAGDKLIWNGASVYPLEASDVVSLRYNAI